MLRSTRILALKRNYVPIQYIQREYGRVFDFGSKNKNKTLEDDDSEQFNKKPLSLDEMFGRVGQEEDRRVANMPSPPKTPYQKVMSKLHDIGGRHQTKR